GANYNRSTLADISRQINRQYAIPLILLFHYGNCLTISVVNRRANLKHSQKDVLEKVTMIKDIAIQNTHRAHVEIIHDLSIEQLGAKHTLSSFDALHKAWTVTLDINALNKKFYKELSNWYFWAINQVTFPDGEEKDREKRNSISIIRLLTRMIFVWFMKEKGLIPEKLFDVDKINTLIKLEDAQQSAYYKAILQNLFFATLNTEMEKDKTDSRRFRKEIKGNTNPDFNVHTLYRYEKLFIEPDTAITALFGKVPFLNGGLFECLDTEYEENNAKHYIRIDGFSDRHDNVLKVPDALFLKQDEEEIDLNTIYGTKNRHYKVRGLLSLLHSYKFTVAENTPVEEEVALDPELLGRVFENLLAAYNPETKSTARHETGSFYTPREIVDYMVDESLIAHLGKALPATTDKQKEDNELRLRLLLYYSDEEHLFEDKEADLLINAMDTMKAIDPACGSGAFLMGLLLKMVYILHKIDPHNSKWKAQQIDNINRIINDIRQTQSDPKVRDESIAKQQESIEDIEDTFDKANYEFDYSRKLFLIERCIYGSDIQPIAIQISKLRFFISLLVDQYPKPGKYNQGIRALPNLETNLVAANSLIPMEMEQQIDFFFDTLFENFQKEISAIHNEYFSARARTDKQRIRKAEIAFRQSFANELKILNVPLQKAELIAKWNPYASNAYAKFFSSKIMFGFANFDIVIANPPYIRQEDIPDKAALQQAGYKVFNSTSDIYTYFYELAYKMLSPSGVACYITSNKWMRSKYGTKLRNLLSGQTCIHTLLDFGGYKVFESATVDTNIMLFHKCIPTSKHKLDYVNIPTDMKPELLSQTIYNSRGSLVQSKLQETGWTLADSAVLKLKEKIEAAGKPLKDWDVNIYYGIKTGCNEAFIIDTATKERLCSEDPKSAEIIKPILRGRDIHRYYYEWAGLWLIATFPTLSLDIDDYPAIRDYLHRFRVKIEQSGDKGSRKKTGNAWFETQDNIAYYDEFEKEKIIYPIIGTECNFTLDGNGYYTNDKTFMITGNDLPYLTALLNSSLFNWYFKKVNSQLGANGLEFRKIYVENAPLEVQDTSLADRLVANVKNIYSIKASNKEKASFEQESIAVLLKATDEMVYQLYGLTEEEIMLIEKGR
ncbi:MAG: Eco57I restriction-modification methylase domain-containing protein, partial [Candidatus Cloacimonas sp.]|nr:Eco57I restriction-modification methylase domain-containing protein [Candidatus Cloacimonas sp.]